MVARTVWVVVAFLVGGVAGGLAVYQGDLTPAAPGKRPSLSSDGVVALRVENVGTHAINATMEVMTIAGVTVWRGDLVVAEQGDVDHALPPTLRGEHIAKGRFTWAEPPRRGTGDQFIPFETSECDGRGLVLAFVVQSTNGIAISSRKDCLSN